MALGGVSPGLMGIKAEAGRLDGVRKNTSVLSPKFYISIIFFCNHINLSIECTGR